MKKDQNAEEAMVQLRILTDDDEHAFFEGMRLWSDGDRGWYSFVWKEGMSYREMLELLRKEREGIDLLPDRVPHTMMYGFVKGKIVGRVSIRHELNERLRARGGHIGYSVAEKYRKQGFATEMVRQALEYCRKLKINEVMVTCADDNVPSWKIIEKYGGTLADKKWDEIDKEMIRRYWVKL